MRRCPEWEAISRLYRWRKSRKGFVHLGSINKVSRVSVSSAIRSLMDSDREERPRKTDNAEHDSISRSAVHPELPATRDVLLLHLSAWRNG